MMIPAPKARICTEEASTKKPSKRLLNTSQPVGRLHIRQLEHGTLELLHSNCEKYRMLQQGECLKKACIALERSYPEEYPAQQAALQWKQAKACTPLQQQSLAPQ